MSRFISELEYVTLHGSDADLDYLGLQERMVVHMDRIGQELILIRRFKLLFGEARTDEGIIFKLGFHAVENFRLGVALVSNA